MSDDTLVKLVTTRDGVKAHQLDAATYHKDLFFGLLGGTIVPARCITAELPRCKKCWPQVEIHSMEDLAALAGKRVRFKDSGLADTNRIDADSETFDRLQARWSVEVEGEVVGWEAHPGFNTLEAQLTIAGYGGVDASKCELVDP